MEIGSQIRRVESCPSTNSLAKDMALAGEKEGTVIIADEQTEGRGRMGRRWFSAKNKGLYLSVILRPSQPTITLLPLAAGLAVKEALENSIGIRILLEWPNDLMWEDKKIGGILCESGFLGERLSYVILGIGLNLNHDPEDFPQEIRPKATSLKMAKGGEVRQEEILLKLWSSLNRWYGLFIEGKAPQIISSFEENSALPLGKRVVVTTEKERFEGIFRGIDSNGGLVVEALGKRRIFFSGDTQSVISQ